MDCLTFVFNALKIPQFLELLSSIFEYFYIRWRVMRSVSGDINEDDDSLASSSDFPPRRKIIRTDSVYPPFYNMKRKKSLKYQYPSCIDIYHSFMNNEDSNNNQIFSPVGPLSNANCTNSESFDGNSRKFSSEASEKNEQVEISENLHSPAWTTSQNSLVDIPDEILLETYKNWISTGEENFLTSEPQISLKSCFDFRKNMKQYLYDAENQCLYSCGDAFEDYFQRANKGSQVLTYPEEQRQIRNYFFTSPRLQSEAKTCVPNNEENFQKYHYSNKTENEESDFNTCCLENCSSYHLQESFNLDLDQISLSDSSSYKTCSVSSTAARNIAERFSQLYWNVNDRNGDDAVGASDNYHNRFFGKSGYFLTREAINNHVHEKDAMPLVEKKELQKEKSRWEIINRLGRSYENVILPVPDTNGTSIDAFENEYEKHLPSYTNEYWKQPKKYHPRYYSIF